MAKQSLKVGLVQTRVGEMLDENLDKTASFIKKAAKKGADVVCLQELFAHRYFAQTKNDEWFAKAQSIPGQLSTFLADWAIENRIVLIGGSIFEKGSDGKF